MDLKELLQKLQTVELGNNLPVSVFFSSLQSLSLPSSHPLIEDLLNLSSAYQAKSQSLQVFPALFQEALSQRLFPTRNSCSEADFWEIVLPGMRRVDKANFEVEFSQYFKGIYSEREIRRILGLFEGTDVVTFEYFALFVRTAQGGFAGKMGNEVKIQYSKLLFRTVEKGVKGAIGREVLQALRKRGKGPGPKPTFVRKSSKQGQFAAFPSFSAMEETSKLHISCPDSMRTEKIRNSSESALRQVTCKRLLKDLIRLYCQKSTELSGFALERIKKWGRSAVAGRQMRAKRLRNLYGRYTKAALLRAVYGWKAKAGQGWASMRVHEEMDSPSLCFSGEISWERQREDGSGQKTALLQLNGVLKPHITLRLYHSFRLLATNSQPRFLLLKRLLTRNSLQSQSFSLWKSLTLAHQLLTSSQLRIAHLTTQLSCLTEQRLVALLSRLYERNEDKRLGRAWRLWQQLAAVEKVRRRVREGWRMREELTRVSTRGKGTGGRKEKLSLSSERVKIGKRKEAKKGKRFEIDDLQDSIKRVRISHGFHKLLNLCRQSHFPLCLQQSFQHWNGLSPSLPITVLSPPRVVVSGFKHPAASVGKRLTQTELRNAILALRSK